MATEGVENTVAQIVHAAKTAIASAGVKNEEVAGIGIGSPGHIDDKNGVILWAPNFYEQGKPYQNVPLTAPISSQMGLPVLLQLQPMLDAPQKLIRRRQPRVLHAREQGFVPQPGERQHRAAVPYPRFAPAV